MARIRDNKNTYKILVGISEGLKLLGRRRFKWENNTELDLKEKQYWLTQDSAQ